MPREERVWTKQRENGGHMHHMYATSLFISLAILSLEEISASKLRISSLILKNHLPHADGETEEKRPKSEKNSAFRSIQETTVWQSRLVLQSLKAWLMEIHCLLFTSFMIPGKSHKIWGNIFSSINWFIILIWNQSITEQSMKKALNASVTFIGCFYSPCSWRLRVPRILPSSLVFFSCAPIEQSHSFLVLLISSSEFENCVSNCQLDHPIWLPWRTSNLKCHYVNKPSPLFLCLPPSQSHEWQNHQLNLNSRITGSFSISSVYSLWR